MSKTQRDVESALFGSPLGAIDMLVGVVMFLAALVSVTASLVSRNVRRPKGRHRA